MIISRLNFEKLLFRPELLVMLRDGETFFPVHATISLTNLCNHRCIWCTVYEYQQGKARFFPGTSLLAFLGQARTRGLAAVTYVGNGEPTLHPDFEDIARKINALGIEQGIFTNGTNAERLADTYLDCFTFVRFSLDAGSPETHAKMHGVTNAFDSIISGIRTLCDLRRDRRGKKPQIGIQYVFHNDNIDGIHEAASLAKEIGVDYLSFKPAFNRGALLANGNLNTLSLHEVHPHIMKALDDFSSDDFAIYFREFQVDGIDRNTLNYDCCVAGLFNILIYEDEQVIICGPKRVVAGTIRDQPERLAKNIEALYRSLPLDNCPGGCRYHSLNHLAYLLRNPEARQAFHENFI
ncbi:MAG: radical SAM protein [Thermodesulfobacteriota bacterium]